MIDRKGVLNGVRQINGPAIEITLNIVHVSFFI